MNILGLDISTSTVGLCILDEHEKLIFIDYIKPTGNSLFEKLDSAVKQFNEKLKEFTVDKIYAEQPNVMFSKGLSSAQVIATVLRFNGGFLFTIKQKYGILNINEIMASSARKNTIGIGRYPKGVNAKEEVFKWVNSNSKNSFNWPLKIKGKHKGQIIPECYDMCDAYIISAFGVKKENN